MTKKFTLTRIILLLLLVLAGSATYASRNVLASEINSSSLSTDTELLGEVAYFCPCCDRPVVREVRFDSEKEMIEKGKEQEALDLTVLHTNFDADWRPGDEFHGFLIVGPDTSSMTSCRAYGAESYYRAPY